MMNFGEGDSQMVEFSPALPYHGAFFLRTTNAAPPLPRAQAGFHPRPVTFLAD